MIGLTGVRRALERRVTGWKGDLQVPEWRLVQGRLAGRGKIWDRDLLLFRRILLGKCPHTHSHTLLLLLHEWPDKSMRAWSSTFPSTVLGDMERRGVRGGRLEVQGRQQLPQRVQGWPASPEPREVPVPQWRRADGPVRGGGFSRGPTTGVCEWRGRGGVAGTRRRATLGGGVQGLAGACRRHC
jgi:hypothetical protein